MIVRKRANGNDAALHSKPARIPLQPELNLYTPYKEHFKRSLRFPSLSTITASVKMRDVPMSIKLAQAVGITTSSALAGSVFTVSAMLVPRLLESPSPLLLKQWKHNFDVGKASVPPLAGICTLCFGYLAYEAKRAPNVTPRLWQIYTTSALLCIGIVPYTLAAMASTNNKLAKKAEETNALQAEDKVVEIGLGGESAHQLVDKWATLNVGRAVMLATAAVLSTWATLQ